MGKNKGKKGGRYTQPQQHVEQHDHHVHSRVYTRPWNDDRTERVLCIEVTGPGVHVITGMADRSFEYWHGFAEALGLLIERNVEFTADDIAKRLKKVAVTEDEVSA